MSIMRGSIKPIDPERLYSHLRGIPKLTVPDDLGKQRVIFVQYPGTRRELLGLLGQFGDHVNLEARIEHRTNPPDPEVAA